MKDNETLIKNISRYVASNIFQRACGIVNTFIKKPKLLPPELYGLWNLINIITTYATAHLGTRSVNDTRSIIAVILNEGQKNY
ncbi:hypothetical protein [Candidatus Magnetominusculus xianensis]|uniref:Uncharacterized protein n=1 Tax=Candidatus Magnetominusculus xianensis TaxID=1748249 RepID=A0ABR5SDI8_9BACT|nr:hypothetical protein [Candidatus Magnetominusculus xianensis]KWT82985.1 hypothetical protein ASN18_2346 [Candidatus Magnetominusculus xianensis]MBF0403064.1 hypothetical protein [Nitrospirota bacterium]